MKGVKRLKIPITKYISHGDAMCSMVTIVNCIAYLKFAKNNSYKFSSQEKKFVCMVE